MRVVVISDIPSYFPINAYAETETNWIGNNSFWDLMSWISSLEKSGHSVLLVNGSAPGLTIDFNKFDLIFIHYSAGFPFDNFQTGKPQLSNLDIRQINQTGTRVLVSFQDEYRNVEPRRIWLDQFF